MITVSPTSLNVGVTVTVCVKNSSKPPGTTIQVRIDNGEGETRPLEIVLGEHGSGCADWTVPDWVVANFNYSSCAQVTMLITPRWV